MRSLIDEDVDLPKRYEVESEKEGASSKAPMTSGKTNMKDGVTEKLKRLKGELLADLNNQTGAHTSLRTTSSFVAHIQEETIPKNS